MKAYQVKNFKLYDFVPRDVYRQRGSKAWQFLDPRLLYTVDKLHDYFGTRTTVNNWFDKTRCIQSESDIEKILQEPTTYQYRGFRPPWSKVGPSLCQQRFGRGAEVEFDGISAETVRKEILANQTHDSFMYITVLEEGSEVLYLDVRQTSASEILVVKSTLKEFTLA